MSQSVSPKGYQLLLIEPSAMVRGLIAKVMQDLGLAQVHQTSNWNTAHEWLKDLSVDAIIVSASEAEKAEELLTLVRMSQFRCDADVPVIAIVPDHDRVTREKLTELNVRQFLSIPFRIRDVADQLYRLWPVRSRQRYAGQ